MPTTPTDLARIGAALYAGATYRGQDAWQSWLADGIGVLPRAVRQWLEGKRSIPEPVARLLLSAEPLAKRLDLAHQPRGTWIAGRLAELAATAGKDTP